MRKLLDVNIQIPYILASAFVLDKMFVTPTLILAYYNHWNSVDVRIYYKILTTVFQFGLIYQTFAYFHILI